MDIGMAWNDVIVKVCSIGVLWPLIAFAQPVAAPPPEGEVSKECQTPGVKVALDRPLPNTLAALKDRKVIKILTIGASASAGADPASGGYQDIIEEVLERRVSGLDVQIIDRGISGELARDAAARLKTEVALAEPDLVLWQVGTNDALAQIPVEEFSQTVSEAISWLKEHNVDVVLVGLHYVRNMRSDPHYQTIRAALSRIAEAEKILRISRYEAMEVIEKMRQSTPSEKVSAFELTEDAYSCLAEYVVRAITSAIFLKRPSFQPTH
jgi:acyl-CoA thioesterase-1